MPPDPLPATARPVLFILGPTAVGKSALALEMAERFGAALLSLDAMQVYRGADIGTGKPTAEEQARVPHGGINLVEPGERFTTADFLRHAAAFLAQCRREGRPVIAAGGTGLYFRALTRGLCEAPATPPALQAELDALPLEALRERLRRVDPSMAEPAASPLDLANPRRIARAIAVAEISGKSLLQWQLETPEPLIPVQDFTSVLLLRDLPDLRERIAARVRSMVSAGWADEVARLVTQHGLPAIRDFPAIGYGSLAIDRKEAARKLDISFPDKALSEKALHRISTQPVAPDIVEQIIIDTRHYAKRQLTWFRKESIVRQINLSRSATLNFLEWWT
ncbi:tRNA (adenosine(37)-N6)-dimethylallyltransferase MiaA [Verrucomicrobia bacterium LW23]|nr:tRNA (adenosine(37)-N6)-dimethylallyltransferase MiaA [Verrucomicrobia bacterium LW23]